MSSRRIPALLGVLCMLVPLLTGSLGMNSQDDPPEGLAPEDIWSEDYANDVYPWGGNDRIQFKEYHDYSAAYVLLGKTMEKLLRKEEAIEVYRKGIAVASKKGDLMPLKEMQQKLNQLLHSGP